ncbi:hypothetical protein AgCh_039203 [Apium graveolens]
MSANRKRVVDEGARRSELFALVVSVVLVYSLRAKALVNQAGESFGIASLLSLITPGGGAAPSTPSWILRRCRGVAVVGFLQNNTGNGLESHGASGVRLSPSRAWANVSRAGIYQGYACRTEVVRSGVEIFLPPSLDCAEFGESGLRPDCVEFCESGLMWLSLAGVEFFLSPSPDFVEFCESGLRWLSLEGVELFLSPSPDCVEFCESGLSPDCVEFCELGLRWLSLAGVELFLPPSLECVEFGESGLRWLSLEGGVEFFLSPSPDFVEFCESGLSPDCIEFCESGLRWLSLAGVEFFLSPSPDCVEFCESGLRWLSLAGVELFLPPSPDCIEFCESGLRFMVWTKALAKAYITCYPGPSSSDSESSGNSKRVEMGKKASTLDCEAITKLSVAKISSRKVPCSLEGLWVENLRYFITKSEEIEDSFYYRSISIVAKEHYELKDEYAVLDHEAQDSAVRGAFQLDHRIEWRWPTPDEKAHHRPADGFVPVWLEHLRSGWNLYWHLFLKHLCKYVYKIFPMQITPKGIKWMTWFIATCNQFKVQPTFKLWHHIFHLVRSSQFPLYELQFRAPECGYCGSYRPVIQQSSLKY